jgi:translation elongation factor EF-Tu-like GTPase
MKRELIMIIDDVFHIIGRGVIVTGQIQNEKIEVGQKVIIDPEFLPEFDDEIKGIEAFRKNLKIANKNDYVGIVLSEVEKNKVKKKMKIYSI